MAEVRCLRNPTMMNMKSKDIVSLCRRVLLLPALVFLSLAVLPLAAHSAAPGHDNARWVNPMIGTALSDAPTLWGNYGGTYPGAVSPWGMVQLSPETSTRPSEKGYYYSDKSILKFTCLGHNSGYPNGSAGSLDVIFMRGACSEMPSSYAGRAFSHSAEEAQPGYYRVRFDDGDEVALTAATHAGIMKYSTASATTTLVVCRGGAVSVVTPSEVHCEKSHAVFTFSQPITSYTLRGDTLYAQFDTRSPLEVRLSVSSSGFSQSIANGRAQLSGGGFTDVRRAAYASWQRELQCVDIEGADESLMRKFYTALYHAMLMPCNTADVGCKPHYSGFSPWDTFRTLHPLLSLLKPEVQADIVDAMMADYARHGALPRGPMTGYHAIPILLDSYIKGVSRHSAADIYSACRRSCDRMLRSEAVRQYMQQGYVGASEEQSVSVTAELAYDDWAMMRLAQLCGDTTEAAVYAGRALNYAHLWDAATLFMLPRDGNRRLRRSGELGYQESNRWTASLFAPHNVLHLVNLSGGAKNFSDRLQHAFASGNVAFDNETVLHYPWLYVWSRRPELAVQRVRTIAADCYGDTPGGIPGNDDLGSMSSWLAFSVMGLMPVCPGTDEYVIVPPMAEAVTIHLSDGKTMRITGGVGHEQVFMPQPLLNGRSLNRCHITHAELISGGTLSYDRHTALDASAMQLPYSLSEGVPQFSVTADVKVPLRVRPDEKIALPIRVSNSGAEGVCVVALTCDGDTVACRNVLVGAGESVADTLVCRLYAEGRRTLRLAEHAIPVRVVPSTKSAPRLRCTAVGVNPVIRKGESLSVRAAVKNVSGKFYAKNVPVCMGDRRSVAIQVALSPGEERVYSVVLPAVDVVGMHTVSVLGVTEKVKVYADTLSATVLDVEFADGSAADISGFGNDGRCFGPLSWDGGALVTTTDAYVEFPASASLMHPYQEFTMLTWVRPSRTDGKGYIDFFTKGDYNVLKIQGGNALGFFAGGWGRGECEATLPADWYDRWHLVAGVCSRGSIRIYIDGRLKQTVPVQGTVAASEMQWNLGRNAEMPYSRFGNMSFRATRIYAAALSDAMIMRIYCRQHPDSCRKEP